MNKLSFVEEAPGFYALAIAVALLETKQEVRTLSQLELSVANLSLDHRPLVEAGMRILQGANVAETIREAFGPPVYRRKPLLSSDWLYNTAGEEIPIFRRFAEIRNQVWLAEAIRRSMPASTNWTSLRRTSNRSCPLFGSLFRWTAPTKSFITSLSKSTKR